VLCPDHCLWSEGAWNVGIQQIRVALLPRKVSGRWGKVPFPWPMPLLYPDDGLNVNKPREMTVIPGNMINTKQLINGMTYLVFIH
jgi:hypothetical protein